MASLNLSEEQLRETVQRAREIAAVETAPAAPETDFAVYVKAAEELGIPPGAMLQAMREQLLVPADSFKVGAQVFAPSVDKRWYVATIDSLEGHASGVRFVHGGEHQCAVSDLRPLALVPGRKVQADVYGCGWLTVTLERFDAAAGKVYIQHAEMYGIMGGIPLAKIRLEARHANPEHLRERATPAQALALRVALTAGSAGLLLGWLLGHFLR